MDCRPPGFSVHEISPGKTIGVGCHFSLQRIFLTQESNPHLLHLLNWQAESLPLSHLGSPFKYLLSHYCVTDHAPGVRGKVVGKNQSGSQTHGDYNLVVENDKEPHKCKVEMPVSVMKKGYMILWQYNNRNYWRARKTFSKELIMKLRGEGAKAWGCRRRVL